MKSTRTKIVVICVAIIYLTIRYISTPNYCVDFPCFYELKDGILKTSFLQPGSIKDLVVFISYYPEHASGGGCFDKSVQKRELVDYLGHQIKLTDAGLFIDNKITQVSQLVKLHM